MSRRILWSNGFYAHSYQVFGKVFRKNKGYGSHPQRGCMQETNTIVRINISCCWRIWHEYGEGLTWPINTLATSTSSMKSAEFDGLRTVTPQKRKFPTCWAWLNTWFKSDNNSINDRNIIHGANKLYNRRSCFDLRMGPCSAIESLEQCTQKYSTANISLIIIQFCRWHRSLMWMLLGDNCLQ